jgi:tetratricopeptide (TPR) repeat protein
MGVAREDGCSLLPRRPRTIPGGLSLNLLLGLIGAGFVASMMALGIVRLVGEVTLRGAAWWGFNMVVWAALALLLAGTEQPRILWVMAQSTKVVEFTRKRFQRELPRWELSVAGVFFGLLAANWFRTFGWGTAVLALPAAVAGVVRVVRRAPFSRWQWTGAAVLVARQVAVLAGARSTQASIWMAVSAWVEVALWWLITHGVVKRDDDALLARASLTQASKYIEEGRFELAEQQVRQTLPLAPTAEIASAALQVLAATLAPRLRIAEAKRALEGAAQLDPRNGEARKRIDEINRIQAADVVTTKN